MTIILLGKLDSDSAGIPINIVRRTNLLIYLLT